MEQNDEQWRPVVGWEGVYEVSDHGRVKRLVPGKRTYAGRIFDQSKRPKGYRSVTLSYDDEKATVIVHRLVAEAFIGTCPEGHEINHKDGDPSNNRPSNLEYVTASQNALHSYRVLGRVQYDMHGTNNPNAKLTSEQIDKILALYRAGIMTKTALARKFGVGKSTISRVTLR